MKTTILFITIMGGIICTVYAQVTSYGVNAGTGGQYNSNFGEGAGQELNSTSNLNTAIGYAALKDTDDEDASYNTAVGARALLRGGTRCVAVGYSALINNDFGENTGIENVAVGASALYNNQNGDYNTGVGTSVMFFQNGNYNTALGHRALYGTTWTTASYNTAVGASALFKNTSGSQNSANGYQALYENVDGSYNVAFGSYSLHKNNTGNYNTGHGYYSLYSNATGYQNTAIGEHALYGNLEGYFNTAIGSNALNTNNGNFNTATGYYAGYNNSTGTHNTAHGFRALLNYVTGTGNTAQGASALESPTGGDLNSALGYLAGPTLDLLNNTTAIGYLARPTASNQVRLGNTSVTSIGGQVEWTAFSDGRFKRDIKEDVSGLDFIKGLRPVSYTVDKTALNKFLRVNDSSAIEAQGKSVPMRQTGFIAQEVEALVKRTGAIFYGVDAPENENDPYGIRYATLVVPLVKAVQELSAKVKDQRRQIETLLAQLDLENEQNETSTQAALLQNSPNPFDTDTAIKMTLPENVRIATLMIYNLEGKQMKNVQISGRGDVEIKISASELSAGMYLYSLIADGKMVETKRMVLTR